MRILRREISHKDGAGMVRLLCEESEDMYHVYQLLHKGDLVRASTVRKVVQETSTGSVQSSRVRMTLTLQVEDVEYDAEQGSLRVKGRNREMNPFVKLGSYHTLELELHRDFCIMKACWDAMHLERLSEASDPAQRAQVAAVVMQMGLASVCLVTSQMTVVRSRISQNVSKKRGGDSRAHDKGVDTFFKQVFEAMVRHVNFDVVKVLIIASPGFVKDDFVKYVDLQLADNTTNRELAGLRGNRSKIILVHASSGHKHALTEVLGKDDVQARIRNTKAGEEVVALERFFEALNTDDGDKACYSYSHVRAALDVNAVDMLLVSDELFRSANFGLRKKYVALVEDARAQGAAVFVLSRLHESGEQLYNLSGVAAVLRYPIAEFEDEEDGGGGRGEREEEEPPTTNAPVQWGEGWEPSEETFL
jgi:protein pelota